jgi:putative PIN family toxin of toxin-antitoxin system
MTIVLDTNCLIQILPKKAEHRWLYDAILSGKTSLAITNEISLEYEETINDFYDSNRLGGNVTKLLLELPKTRRIDVHFRWFAIQKDPDDDKYVDCAVAASADFIITNDAHFKSLKKLDFPKVKCLGLDEFLKIWEAS